MIHSKKVEFSKNFWHSSPEFRWRGECRYTKSNDCVAEASSFRAEKLLLEKASAAPTTMELFPVALANPFRYVVNCCVAFSVTAGDKPSYSPAGSRKSLIRTTGQNNTRNTKENKLTTHDEKGDPLFERMAPFPTGLLGRRGLFCNFKGERMK